MFVLDKFSLPKRKKEIKENNENNEPQLKDKMRKHTKDIIVIFGFVIIFILVSGFSGIKDTGDNDAFVQKLANNKLIQELLGIEVNGDIIVPSENETEKFDENIGTTTDVSEIKNNTPCVIGNFEEDTLLTVVVNGKHVTVKLKGVMEFEYSERLKSHIDFSSLVYGQAATIVFDNENYNAESDEYLEVYIILQNGKNLNQLLIENGYAFIDMENRDFSKYDEFLVSAKYAYDNNLGYWKERPNT